MSLIVRIIVIAVNDPDGIVELQSVFESQAAPRIAFQHPFRFHPYADPGRDLDGFPRFQRDIRRREEIISGASCRRAAREPDIFINIMDFFLIRNPQRVSPPCKELFKTYFFKLCDSLHDLSSLNIPDSSSTRMISSIVGTSTTRAIRT